MTDETASKGLPELLSADELYETLMGGIERDLLLENLPNVIPAMKNDTPEQRAERTARYDAAFAEYDRRLTEHKKAWDKAFAAYKHESMNGLKAFFIEADDRKMESIEHELNTKA